jgi:hypothetical protein
MVRVSGDHSRLSIIPLLLVSLLEDRLRNGNYDGSVSGNIEISFSAQTMKVDGESVQTGRNNTLHPSLQLRLQEFYENKYRFASDAQEAAWFEIQLNETIS